jgi:ABC-type antimicrobial peptide transport system permease subunit
MSGVFIAESGAFAGPPAVLVTLIASLILLAIRAWVGSEGFTLTRRVSHYLDGAIGIFFVLFVLIVIVRFKSLAG